LSSSRAKTFYHPELDALRFLAFCLVFFAHSAGYTAIDLDNVNHAVSVILSAMRGASFYGVDLFFVLSSYLITELLLRERERTGTVHLRKFYIRRALRIWPLYFFFLLIVRPVASTFLPDEHLSWTRTAAFLLFAGNWASALRGWPHSVTADLWSITVEEQFYLAWPLVLMRRGLRLGYVALGLFIVSNTVRAFMVIHPHSDTALWSNTFTRLDPFAGGILLACLLHGRENRLSPITRGLLVSTAAIVLGLVGFWGDHTDRRALFSYPGAAVGCVLLVWAVLRPMNSWQPGRVGNAAIYLGRISYGLYVFHLLCYEIVSLFVPRMDAFGVMALTMLLTLCLASLSYRFLEMPFLRIKRRFTLVPSRDEVAIEQADSPSPVTNGA
jgi:peptidoglycan/LPS O-acetylase OafA/YrhL